jgi:hypothetical protein
MKHVMKVINVEALPDEIVQALSGSSKPFASGQASDRRPRSDRWTFRSGRERRSDG